MVLPAVIATLMGTFLLISCNHNTTTPVVESSTPEGDKALELVPANFKIAIIGDSGKGKGFEQVLQLIKREQAQMVLHVGDLAYNESSASAPKQWNAVVDTVLGPSYPFFIVVGNHDVKHWSIYNKLFQNRLKQLPPNTCIGQNGASDLGVKSSCTYQGVFFVLSGINTIGTGHQTYLRNTLAENRAMPWKICAWHKNQRDMQAGTKTDEVGWEAYQICQQEGAFIVNGHEHSYARTLTLSALGDRKASHGAHGIPEEVSVGPGKTFVACSGLGGASVRPWNCALHDNDSWWASVHAANFTLVNGKVLNEKQCHSQEESNSQSASYGALFIEFNYQGDEHKARGRFITTSNETLDDFIITRS